MHCRSGCSALRKRLQCTAGKGHIMAYSDLHYRLQIFPLADKRPILWRTVRQAAFVVCYLYRGRCPRLLKVVPSRHQSASGLYFTTDLTDWTDCYLCEAKGKTKTGKTPWRGWRAMSPAAMLTPWSYKSKLLKPKPEAYHHLPYRRSPSSPRR